MSNLFQRAELAKIATLLSVPEADLEYLAVIDQAGLRAFREAATEMLFEADREMLGRSAKAVARLPVRLAAWIARRHVPPRLAARVGELVPSKKAIKLVSLLPGDYVADVAFYSDPLRLSHHIAVMPGEVVSTAVKILSDRDAYITMGRVAPHITTAHFQRALSEMSDAAIVRSLYFVDDCSDIDRISAQLSDATIHKMVDAIQEHGLWTEILGLINVLGNDQRARFVDVIMRRDDDYRIEFLAAIDSNDAWETMLSMFRVLDTEGRQYFGGLVSRRPESMQREYVRAAIRSSLWGDLSGLVLAMPRESGLALLEVCRTMGDETENLGLQELVRQLDEVMKRDVAQDANAAAS